MPTLGPPELIVILVIIIIIFGVGKLPQVGGAIGKSIREFRRSQQEEDEPQAQNQAPSTTKEEEQKPS